MLVDDAIVEIENIVRHMRMGKSAYQASIDAADEIGLAVVATSFCIVAVFLPVGLMPGISGQFFKNFGITVVVSVLMSLAVARMITPMLAAYFLRAHGHAEHGEGKWMDRYMRVLAWTLDRSEMEERRRGTNPVKSRLRYALGALGLVVVLMLVSGVAMFGPVSRRSADRVRRDRGARHSRHLPRGGRRRRTVHRRLPGRESDPDRAARLPAGGRGFWPSWRC